MKRDAFDENPCSFQWPFFDERNYNSVLATSLQQWSARFGIEGSLVRDSSEALGCELEQDNPLYALSTCSTREDRTTFRHD